MDQNELEADFVDRFHALLAALESADPAAAPDVAAEVADELQRRLRE